MKPRTLLLADKTIHSAIDNKSDKSMRISQQDGGTCLQADFMQEILLENTLNANFTARWRHMFTSRLYAGDIIGEYTHII